MIGPVLMTLTTHFFSGCADESADERLDGGAGMKELVRRVAYKWDAWVAET